MAGAGAFGVALPHRAVRQLHPDTLTQYAVRAEQLGFRDLGVTENVVDRNFCLAPALALGHAAAATTRIGLGVAVIVLPVHHPIDVADAFASLQTLSGGRVTLGVGLGRPHHYEAYGVPLEHRVTRFTESVGALRALWRDPVATSAGTHVRIDGVPLSSRPVAPPPLWFGGGSPAALHRAARLADGWVGSGGGESVEQFGRNVVAIREHLDSVGRAAERFTISKRVFLSIDDDPGRACAELASWFGDIYGNPDLAYTHGIYGSATDIAAHIEELRDAGADHLILNPVDRHLEQLEELSHVVGAVRSTGG